MTEKTALPHKKGQASVIKTPPPTADFAELFTSRAFKGLVLLLIICFNMVVLRNSFLLLSPSLSLSGDRQLDALLYGVSMSMLMVIILFHEEQWENMLCPGAFVLYIDAAILILYMNWLGWLLGSSITVWILTGLMSILPVLGLFIMVIMLKK
ncbi:MAG: hypothetical protein EAZ55_09840 [Cytophagales bacterium]|nr:MAG: hypothetical protein EAZ55_09840 [Cytophagales bacterium]